VTTATPTQRITDLESAAFRTDRGLGQLTEQVELLRGEVGQVRSDVELVRGAVNELSVEVRSQRHDLNEISARVDQIHQEHGAMLRQILTALGTPLPHPNTANAE
jgi:chromosome segregation ATPase